MTAPRPHPLPCAVHGVKSLVKFRSDLLAGYARPRVTHIYHTLPWLRQCLCVNVSGIDRYMHVRCVGGTFIYGWAVRTYCCVIQRTEYTSAECKLRTACTGRLADLLYDTINYSQHSAHLLRTAVPAVCTNGFLLAAMSPQVQTNLQRQTSAAVVAVRAGHLMLSNKVHTAVCRVFIFYLHIELALLSAGKLVDLLYDNIIARNTILPARKKQAACMTELQRYVLLVPVCYVPCDNIPCNIPGKTHHSSPWDG